MTTLVKSRAGNYFIKNPTEEGLQVLRDEGYRLQRNETRKDGTGELLAVSWLAATDDWVKRYQDNPMPNVAPMEFAD